MNLLTLFSLFLGLSLSAFAQSSRGPSPSGIVSEVYGGLIEIKNKDGQTVASTKKGTSKNQIIKKDFPFYEGETFVTGADGKIKLQFAEGKNEVFLGPNTTLVIQKAPFDLKINRGTRLFLDSGTVDSTINLKYSGIEEEDFRIETKTLVAGVRGTVFKVEHDSNTNVSSVNVTKGIVEVKSMPDGKTRSVLRAHQSISSIDWRPQSKALDLPKKNSSDSDSIKIN